MFYRGLVVKDEVGLVPVNLKHLGGNSVKGTSSHDVFYGLTIDLFGRLIIESKSSDFDHRFSALGSVAVIFRSGTDEFDDGVPPHSSVRSPR